MILSLVRWSRLTALLHGDGTSGVKAQPCGRASAAPSILTWGSKVAEISGLRVPYRHRRVGRVENARDVLLKTIRLVLLWRHTHASCKPVSKVTRVLIAQLGSDQTNCFRRVLG